MQVSKLIHKISGAGELIDIFQTKEIEVEYKKALGLLHPDVCKMNGSVEAFQKLIQLKIDYDKSRIIEDDAGTFEHHYNTTLFKGNEKLHEISYDNYILLKNFRDKASLSFHKYLPASMALSHQLKITYAKRAVPLSRLVLPQKHVLWILSRTLEVTAWFSQMGYVHGGIHPESIFIIPETHGVVLGSFYHFSKTNSKLKSISAKYKHWYPHEIFDKKRATTTIDLELTKRTAAYVLGDTSGIGIKLKKDFHPALIEFLLKKHKNAFQCYDDYRKMLKNNFEVKYHELKI